jgi:hypothetical protein
MALEIHSPLNFSMNATDMEKLLRRIEISRLFNAPLESFELGEVLEITCLFISYSTQARDWRFLNAALKLADWLRAHGHLTQQVGQMEAEALAALRAECGLNRLFRTE